jgi:hypothetical protein
MTYSALLWEDGHCNREHLFCFRERKDMLEMISTSIERSICWLETNVFSLRGFRRGGEHCIEVFINSQPQLTKKTEKRLRESVLYWKHEGIHELGMYEFRMWALRQDPILPTVVVDNIISFV